MSYHQRVKDLQNSSSAHIQVEERGDLAEGSFLEKWPAILRWILFLPSAIVLGLLGQALFYLIQTSFENIQDGSFLHGLINMARTGIMFGLFVGIGAYVAPRRQLIVATVMLVIATIIISLLIFSVLIVGNGYFTGIDQLYYLLHALVGLASAGCVVYYVKEELENK